MISFAKTLWVMSSASWASRTIEPNDVADVVGVADVEEVEGAAVALLEGDDGAAHELRLRGLAAGRGRTLISVRDGGCRLATGGH